MNKHTTNDEDDLDGLYREQRELRERAADGEAPPSLATQVLTAIWFGLGIILGGLLLAFGVLTVWFFPIIMVFLLMVSMGVAMSPSRSFSALGRGMLVSAVLAVMLFLFLLAGSG